MKSEQRRYTIRELPVSDRPRERLERFGPQALSNSELLAIVLRTGNGHENALQLAQRLLVLFQGIPGLAHASINELTQIKGVGKAKAVEVHAALELGRRFLSHAQEDPPKVTSPADAANLLMLDMMGLEQEQLRAIFLDTRNQVLSIPTVYMGSLNTTTIRIGEIFKQGIKENAAALIVAHNHPSGDPSPSPEDITTTRHLIEAGKILDMEVMDHIIIGHQRYVSLKERGLAFE